MRSAWIPGAPGPGGGSQHLLNPKQPRKILPPQEERLGPELRRSEVCCLLVSPPSLSLGTATLEDVAVNHQGPGPQPQVTRTLKGPRPQDECQRGAGHGIQPCGHSPAGDTV